jgi:predicted transcriptional regulator
MHVYTLPQEIEVWYIIPAVRRELSRLLTGEHGLSYDRAGDALGISKAAISQYNKNKRASKVLLHPRVLKEVEKAADSISRITKKHEPKMIRSPMGHLKKGGCDPCQDKTVKEILRILKFMRDKKLPFNFCEDGAHSQEECREIKVAYEKYWE